MIALQLLGGLSLTDQVGAPSPILRPRVFALLALLAGHGVVGISRDKLLAYLWPESDTEHARNSLRQALFSLRHGFDCRPLTTGIGFLRLNALEAQVDLWDFEAALRAGKEELAAALYRGPLLDGFYITGLPEFERWVDAERDRLAHDYARALSSLALRADSAGDRVAAITWWRRLAAAEPLSATPALGLMLALEAAGDPTAAVNHGRRHVAVVETELGAPASGEILAMMRRLGFESRKPLYAQRSRSELREAIR